MRQCWVRDIADFAKYGLLKRLAGPELRLGIFWYVTDVLPALSSVSV